MPFHRPVLRLCALLCLPLGLGACKPSTPEPAPAAAAPPATATAAPAAAEVAPAPATLAPDSAPIAEVKASMDRFLAAGSFHASMHMQGAQTMTTEMDFVAPDRYRMQMPGGTQVIIGDTLYLQAEGKVREVPLPAGTVGQWRDPLQLQQNKADLSVEALGSEIIDGRAARKYLVRNTLPATNEFTYWVGEDGLPLQLLHRGQAQGKPYSMTLRYSRFDDPSIAIDAPR